MGQEALEQTAPGHVAQVWATVLEPLMPDEVEQLSILLGKVVGRLETDSTVADSDRSADTV